MQTFQAIVYPSQCDAMGHMTVQFYTAAFDQAMWGLVYGLGWRPEPDLQSTGFADVKHVVQFHAELRAGEPFRVESRAVRSGSSSLVTEHRMTAVATGELIAECEMTSVHFDLKGRRAKPHSAQFKDVLAAAQQNADGNAIRGEAQL